MLLLVLLLVAAAAAAGCTLLCPYKAVGGAPPLCELPITLLAATNKCHKLDINDQKAPFKEA